MLSSSSDDEAMFPSELDPPGSTSHNNLGSLEAQSSVLSPPQSQELHDVMDTAEGSHVMNGADQIIDAAQGIDQSNGNSYEPRSDFTKSAEMVQEPGSSWNNKKSKEEWQKAWNQIEDKNFTLSE